MESKEVSLPWIHIHSMVPWNSMEKGNCCGRFESFTDGYYCESCNFFVHKICSESLEYIQHPSHSDHTLQLQIHRYHNCNVCGKVSKKLLYRCEICDFDIDLSCARNPPPEIIYISKKHGHKLTLFKDWKKFNCDAKCGKNGEGFPYKCHECDIAFHVKCVWHPVEVKHPLQYTTIHAGERVSLPWMHKHFMVPLNDLRKGDCCGRVEGNNNGYYCKHCNFFVHKKCGDEAPESIQHPSHSLHFLWLRSDPHNSCDLCGKTIVDAFYSCHICGFDVDLHCAKYPPPEVIDISKTHYHKLTLLKELVEFECDAKCGKKGEGYPYNCRECNLTFHVDCVWQPPEVKHPLEVNHSHHPWHPLKLLMGQLPSYSDGKCRLCERKIDERLYYHCSSCNFTLDMRCVLNPPPQSLQDLKVHEHQLTLLPRLDSFTCNAFGMKGDRSPYVCFQCGFMIHQECLKLPRIININRHDHRISRTSILGVVNSVCGVWRKKVDWTCGGYSCQKCPGYVVHSKCATRKEVWNGKELEGVPEEIEDLNPYKVIDENTIQHFSHEEHYLRLHSHSVLYEEEKRCRACNYPIYLQSFYSCVDCGFVLHQRCGEFPKKKRHVLHNEQLTLVTSQANYFRCGGCREISNGFLYKHGKMELDLRCSSISEPFVHSSHPHHPLYYIPQNKEELCIGCGYKKLYVLRCFEDGCEFVLCFGCTTLLEVVNHRVHDHHLSLCYGDKEATGKYWCDISEKEINPKTWFYTCKDHQASLHTSCVLGDLVGIMPTSTITYFGHSFEVVLNNTVSRPFCSNCKSHCMYPIMLKELGTSDTYFCSYKCCWSWR